MSVKKVLEVLATATGFQWDDGNIDKNWEKHSVSFLECEEVFFNELLVVAPEYVNTRGEERYIVLGKTDSGRRLLVVFALRDRKIRVISARDMSKKERRYYQ